MQKKVALINDIAGFGRCAASAMIPILNVMKIQTVWIPTAILSTHPQFPSFYIDDYTSRMKDYIQPYIDMNLQFDAIATGYIGSVEQFDIVEDFIKRYADSTMIMIDPIMGDHGKLYQIYTSSMCQRMKKLIQYANILTPNYTELCVLVDEPYDRDIDEQRLFDMCQKLSSMGPQCIVVTGIKKDDYRLINFVYEDGHYHTIEVSKIGEDRCGTGDVMSGVLLGEYMNGLTFYESVKKSLWFTSMCIEHCERTHIPNHYGLCFEEFLKEL